eukprot:m.12243 g.12243  ORF g.12243 m.12243 type:complete len:105 (-) comp2922_c0_seq2:782-1096(-)
MQIQHPGWGSASRDSLGGGAGGGDRRKGRQTALDHYLERFEKRGRQAAPACFFWRTAAVFAIALWILAWMWIGFDKQIGYLEAVLFRESAGRVHTNPALPRPSP